MHNDCSLMIFYDDALCVWMSHKKRREKKYVNAYEERKEVATYMVKCIDEVRRKVEWEKNDFLLPHTQKFAQRLLTFNDSS